MRMILRALQCDATRVALPVKLVIGAILVPVFGVIVVVSRLHALVKGPITVIGETPEGIRLRCHLPDLIQMYIYAFGRWEPDLTMYIRDRLKPGDTFIDVGANIGYFALLAARAVGETGSVVAIEAAPRIADELRHHVELNDAHNVRILNKAASDRDGTITIYAGPEHNIGLTTTQSGRGLPAEAEINAHPLHALIEHDETMKTRMVKIDVEGGEPAVLAGMSTWLDGAPQDVEILIELSPLWWDDRSRSVDDVLAPFFERGFNLYTIPNNYWPWRYLWPNDVQKPQRHRGSLSANVKRHDIVLSRRDVEQL
jgi:FkbM family methyltransferase